MIDVDICKDCMHLTDDSIPWGSSAAEDNNPLLKFVLVCNLCGERIVDIMSPPKGCIKMLQHAVADGLEN